MEVPAALRGRSGYLLAMMGGIGAIERDRRMDLGVGFEGNRALHVGSPGVRAGRDLAKVP